MTIAIAVNVAVALAMTVSIGTSVPGSNPEIKLWTRSFELQIHCRALLA